MGTPAARIMDPTAHGGMVMVGYPTVIIGNMPASRIGDMHTCPMFTGPVPHVGGPFILGAFNVLVGMMPQSRVGDMLVCVGPPDSLIMGCPTVMVGMAFSGGMIGVVQGLMMAGVAVLQSLVSPPYPRSVVVGGNVVTEYTAVITVAGEPTAQAKTIAELDSIRAGPGGSDFLNAIDAAGKPVTLSVLGDPMHAGTLFPGKQNYENCAVQSSQQIIHQATGKNYSEAEMENVATQPNNSGYTRTGGTPVNGMETILENGGVPAHMEPGTTANIDQALANNQGTITAHDAGKLWDDPAYAGGGHAVVTTGAIQDQDGNTLAYVINDTGTGQAERTVPAADYQNSLLGTDMAVTDNPIW